jgi:hypothetical protein
MCTCSLLNIFAHRIIEEAREEVPGTNKNKQISVLLATLISINHLPHIFKQITSGALFSFSVITRSYSCSLYLWMKTDRKIPEFFGLIFHIFLLFLYYSRNTVNSKKRDRVLREPIEIRFGFHTDRFCIRWENPVIS